jgi:hypothetical protein
MGLGDHYLLLSVLPELRERHKQRGLTLALSYPEPFADSGLPIISIVAARQWLGAAYDASNLYAWCAQQDWKGSLRDAMLGFGDECHCNRPLQRETKRGENAKNFPYWAGVVGQLKAAVQSRNLTADRATN